MTTVTAASTVLLNFSLSLVEGDCIDSNFDQPPVEYTLGSGAMLPGFECELLGMRAGDSKTSVVPAADAFGQHRQENLQSFKPTQFEPGLELREGLVVAFTDAAGAEVPGVISAISAAQVEVDFNHPLAGKDIQFNVQIHKLL
ncbi:MAG: peptidylprolyl isomerase [Pseudomonadales bacterium]|nr:peptidylprolyl isomerase [Pseudomonadales bacterium]